MELTVSPAALGIPAGVRRHPSETAGIPDAASFPKHHVQTPRPTAAECPCSPAETGGEAAVCGHGRPEEGDPGSVGEAEGAEDSEGAALCGLQTQFEVRPR